KSPEEIGGRSHREMVQLRVSFWTWKKCTLFHSMSAVWPQFVLAALARTANGRYALRSHWRNFGLHFIGQNIRRPDAKNYGGVNAEVCPKCPADAPAYVAAGSSPLCFFLSFFSAF